MKFTELLEELGLTMEANETFFRCADAIAEADPDFKQKFLDAMYGPEDGTLQAQHLENFVTDAMWEDIVYQVEANGSTAIRRRCNDCGKELDILVVQDEDRDAGVKVVSDDAVFFGRFEVKEDTCYEKWLCADIGGFDVKKGFTCRRA